MTKHFVILLLPALLVGCGREQGTMQSATTPPGSTAALAAPPFGAAGTPSPASTLANAPGPITAPSGSERGETIYGSSCAVCHQTGQTGAPKIDDKADWAPRIAQGKENLYRRAIEGYTGQKGVMPPKGGNSALSDDDVRAAVNFMVGKTSS